LNNANNHQHQQEARRYSSVYDKNFEVKNLQPEDKITNMSNEYESICCDFIKKYKLFEIDSNNKNEMIVEQRKLKK
jgi:hypothetical protein